MENDALNAINPWDKANQIIAGVPAVKPTLRRNQFGGNIGGPIYIPKLLPGIRDKFFFFANYENFIEHDGNEAGHYIGAVRGGTHWRLQRIAGQQSKSGAAV